MLKILLYSFRFLTILPLKDKQFSARHFALAPVFFPVVGAAVGLLAYLVKSSLPAPSGLISAAITLIAVTWITGGMHLDGLTDTLDALASGKNKEKMLEIMHDPHIGAIGSSGLICLLLLKLSLFASIAPKPTLILPAYILSRWSMVWSMLLFPYARNEGKAKLFMEKANVRLIFLSGLIAVLLLLTISGYKSLSLLLPAMLISWLLGNLVKGKIGGITGDTLGACCEINEVCLLWASMLLLK